jgi:hypothetical protein
VKTDLKFDPIVRVAKLPVLGFSATAAAPDARTASVFVPVVGAGAGSGTPPASSGRPAV